MSRAVGACSYLIWSSPDPGTCGYLRDPYLAVVSGSRCVDSAWMSPCSS